MTIFQVNKKDIYKGIEVAIKPCHLYQSFLHEDHYANLIIIQIFDAFLYNHKKDFVSLDKKTMILLPPYT